MTVQTKSYIDRLIGDSPEAPIVQCIIFPNGDLFRFERTIGLMENQEHIKFLEKSTIDCYFEQNGSEKVSSCFSTTSAENSEYIAYAGEGSFGGDGIIYVIKKADSQLLWFLFSDSSNPFSTVEIQENIIIAISTFSKRWTIPIRSPEKLRIGT